MTLTPLRTPTDEALQGPLRWDVSVSSSVPLTLVSVLSAALMVMVVLLASRPLNMLEVGQ